MIDVEAYRRGIRNLIGRALGRPPEQPTYFVGQQQSQGHAADIVRLPANSCPDIQDLDPSSSTFGQLYFIAGLSVVGGPDIITG